MSSRNRSKNDSSTKTLKKHPPVDFPKRSSNSIPGVYKDGEPLSLDDIQKRAALVVNRAKDQLLQKMSNNSSVQKNSSFPSFDTGLVNQRSFASTSQYNQYSNSDNFQIGLMPNQFNTNPNQVQPFQGYEQPLFNSNPLQGTYYPQGMQQGQFTQIVNAGPTQATSNTITHPLLPSYQKPVVMVSKATTSSVQSRLAHPVTSGREPMPAVPISVDEMVTLTISNIDTRVLKNQFRKVLELFGKLESFTMSKIQKHPASRKIGI